MGDYECEKGTDEPRPNTTFCTTCLKHVLPSECGTTEAHVREFAAITCAWPCRFADPKAEEGASAPPEAAEFLGIVEHAREVTRHPLCVIGQFCSDHGFVHGGEAEELREKLEKLIQEPLSAGLRAELIEPRDIQCLLDEVDARDSLAYLEDQAPNRPRPRMPSRREFLRVLVSTEEFFKSLPPSSARTALLTAIGGLLVKTKEAQGWSIRTSPVPPIR